MLTYISSYPALGRVTAVEGNAIIFTALLECHKDRASDPWDVSLWHSIGLEWHESPLKLLHKDTSYPLPLQAPGLAATSVLHRLYFTSSSPIQMPTSFTIKFRNHSSQPWKWVREQQSCQDGHVLVQTCTLPSAISSHLGHYIENLNNALDIKNCRTESPGTTLWVVQSAIDPAKKDSIIKDVRIGIPWGKRTYYRWFALVQPWLTWLLPRQGCCEFKIDAPAIMASFMSKQGKHLVFLAISGVNNVKAMLSSDDDGSVILQIKSDNLESNVGIVLIALGDTFESANAAVMYHARSIVSSFTTSQQMDNQVTLSKKEDPRSKVWAEKWYDGLTYCTWNGLGAGLTEEKLISAIEQLAKHEINITNLIIDDNWQSINHKTRSWMEFEAEPSAFPNGLKHAISSIREKQPSLQHIAVWHALWGYWNGVDPRGKIAKAYKTVDIQTEGHQNTVVAKEDVGKLYDDFYSFLSSCGIDGVKTDAQCYLDTIEGAQNRRDLIIPYLDAWTVASLRFFSFKVISCMSLTPQHIFHSQLPQNRPPFLLRNSDDFYPDQPDSHTWHVWANAHTAVLTQHLNALPDWDMFQTVHEYSSFHAAARCVSGGPICITDIPGQHNIKLINQISGQSPRGKTIVFRTSNLGKTLDPYNCYGQEKLLLVGTYHGQAITGTGIIGAFNVSSRSLTELVPLSKFPGVIHSQFYIVRSHCSGLISKPFQSTDPHSLLALSIDARGFDILSAYPLRGFVKKTYIDGRSDSSTNEKTIWIAVLGLVAKMVAAATVESLAMKMDEKGRIVVNTRLKALGTLGLYISSLSELRWQDQMLITILGKVVPLHTVRVSETCASVLEVDVEAAWKELGLESRWSNEVEVKVYINASG